MTFGIRMITRIYPNKILLKIRKMFIIIIIITIITRKNNRWFRWNIVSIMDNTRRYIFDMDLIMSKNEIDYIIWWLCIITFIFVKVVDSIRKFIFYVSLRICIKYHTKNGNQWIKNHCIHKKYNDWSIKNVTISSRIFFLY